MKKLLFILMTTICLTGCGNKETDAVAVESAVVETVDEALSTAVEMATEVIEETEETTVEETTVEETTVEGTTVEVTELPELAAGETINITSDKFCARCESGDISICTGYNGNICYSEGLGFTKWVNAETCETWTIITDNGYKYIEDPEILAQLNYTKTLVVSEVLTDAVNNGDGTSVFEVAINIDGDIATGDLILTNSDKSFVSFNGSSEVATYNYSTIDTIPSLPEITFEDVSIERINELILENFF